MNSNPAVATALAHRSIRKFTQQPIAPEILESLIDAGRMASTSNNLQCVSIIRITDVTIRAGIRRAASDMAYVTDCAEFLLFCMDFYKAKTILPEAQVDWAEVSIIGALDTGIMAQNVLLAAESLGLAAFLLALCAMILKRLRRSSVCRNIAYHWWVCVWVIPIRSRP